MPTALVVVLVLVSAACAGDDGSAARAGTGGTPEAASTTVPACLADPSGCTLREVAAARGVLVGTAVAGDWADLEPAYRATLVREFSSVTPENVLKWSAVHPGPHRWAFGPVDALVDLAEADEQAVKGHNLLWDQATIGSTPEWVLAIGDAGELRSVVEEHVTTLVGRYAGRIDRWDVVNEPLETAGTALFRNHFFELLGERYLDVAFAAAHRADPDATLFVNETLVPELPTKADALVALLRRLLRRGVPVDGVGLQLHMLGGPPAPGVVAGYVRRLRAMGLEVALTELDLPADPAGGDPRSPRRPTATRGW